VLHHELPEELAVEAVQVVDAVEQRVARPDAEEQRHLAEPRLQIDDPRRFLAQARKLDAAIYSDGRRAGAAFCAEETPASWAVARAPCVVSRRAAVRRMAP